MKMKVSLALIVALSVLGFSVWKQKQIVRVNAERISLMRDIANKPCFKLDYRRKDVLSNAERIRF